MNEGYEWILDADLKDFFGSVDHEKLLNLLNCRVSDGWTMAGDTPPEIITSGDNDIIKIVNKGDPGR